MYKKDSFRGTTFLYDVVLLLSLLLAGPAHAQVVPNAPVWETITGSTANDGVYTLNWRSPMDAEYIRIEELDAHNNTQRWFSFREFESFVKNEPGTYRYRLSSCIGLIEDVTQCSAWNSQILVTVGSDVRSHHEQMPAVDESAIQNLNGVLSCNATQGGGPGGPNALAPGEWWSPCQSGHGWAFYWVNGLRFPEGAELHRNIYELIGVWLTYRYMDGDYYPVWLYLPMRSSSPHSYEGPLIYQTFPAGGSCEMGVTDPLNPAKCHVTAGHARIIFDPLDNQNATIEWRLNLPGFPVSELTHAIEPLAEQAPVGAPNHVDFYSGWWWRRTSVLDESFAYMAQIKNSVEFDHVIFYDNTGHPIWLSATRSDLDPNNSTAVSYINTHIQYVEKGYPPGLVGGTVTQNPVAGATLSRGFDAVHAGHQRTGTFNASISINANGRSAALNKNVAMTKVVNFHDVDYNIPGQPDGQTVCEVPPGAECLVNLNWFRDDHFPLGTIWRRDLTTQQLSLVTDLAVQAQDGLPQNLPEGSYRYEMYRDAVTESPMMAKSRDLTITTTASTVDLAPIAFADPLLTASNSSAAVGATDGLFNVNATGAATYTIPIMVGEGSGGFKPSVRLQYNSQSGNGMAGLGWSLAAYSLISRCAQTFEQDFDAQNPEFLPSGVQLNEQDRFCLDGQRLMLISGAGYGADGAVYRKELDDFTRVTSFGDGSAGPNCFIAEQRGGGQVYYGNCSQAPNASALINSGLPDGVHYAWAEARMLDLAGNYIDFQYLTPSNGVEILLEKIRYTGNVNNNQTTYASMDFIYEFKPAHEQTISYVAGAKIISQRRLNRIDSKVGADYLRAYHLDYQSNGDGVGRSILESIQECHQPRSSGGICFDKTRFTWQRGKNQLAATAFTQTTALTDYVFDTASNGKQQVRVGDFNGDGHDDLFYVDSGDRLRVAISDGSGQFQILTPVTPQPFIHMTPIDLNSDGFLDITYISTTDNHWYTHLWQGGNLGVAQRIDLGINTTITFDGDYPFVVMDFDGDAAADIITGTMVGGEPMAAIIPNRWHEAGGDIQRTLGDPMVIGFDLSDAFLNVSGGWQPLNNSMPEVDLGSEFSVMDSNGDGVVEMLVKIRQDFCQTANPVDDFFCPSGPAVSTIGNSSFPEALQPYVQYTITTGDAGEGRFGSIQTQADDAIIWAIAELRYEQGMPIYHVNEIAASSACSICDGFQISGSPIFADINGDGLSDTIALGDDAGVTGFDMQWNYNFNQGGGVFLGIPANTLDYDDDFKHSNLGDFNGDGYPDLWIGQGDSNIDQWRVHLWEWTGSGNGRFAPIAVTTQAIAGEVFDSDSAQSTLDSDRSLLLDFNGDGRQDHLLLRKTNNTWSVYPSAGHNALGDDSPAYVIAEIDNGLGDVDGNGLDDADGGKVIIEYSRLTDSSVYERDNNSSHAWYGSGRTPVYDLISSMTVVRRVDATAPAWDVPNTDLSGSAQYLPTWQQAQSFYYRGAKIQGGGRGFLGFRSVLRFNHDDRILSINHQRQDFPYAGQTFKTESWRIAADESPWTIADEITNAQIPCWIDNNCAPVIPLPDECISEFGFGEPCVLTIGPPPDPTTILGPTSGLPSTTQITRGLVEWESQLSITGNGRVYFTFPHLNFSEQFDLDGAIAGRTVQVQNFNEPTTAFYGNLTQSIEYVYSASSGLTDWTQKRTSTFNYDNFTSGEWVLGLLRDQTVQFERPDAPQLSRSKEHFYDPATRLRTAEKQTSGNDNRWLSQTFERDVSGNITQVTTIGSDTGQHRVSQSEYDSLNRWVVRELQQASFGGELQLIREVGARDRYGNPTRVDNQQGLETRLHYDAMGRLFYRWDETGNWQRTQYVNGRGGLLCPVDTAYYRVIDSVAPSGPYAGRAAAPLSRTCVDRAGRDIRTVTENQNAGEWIYQDTQYDITGRVLAQSLPLSSPPSPTMLKHWARNAYDELGRQLLTRLPDGALTSTAYTALTTTVMDPRSNVTETFTNHLGEVVWVKDANGYKTTYAYDAVGNQIQMDGPMPGLDDAIQITYDGFDHRASLDDPDKGYRQYRNNVLGEELCAVDAEGQGVQQFYDGFGRLIKRNDRSNVFDTIMCNDGSVDQETTWDYGNSPLDPATFGQLILEKDSFAERSWNYDQFGRVSDQTTTLIGRGSVFFVQSTTYDEFGRVFQSFDGSPDLGGLRYVYNQRGYTIQQREASNPALVYQTINQRDAFGNITNETLGNGAVTTRLYDERGFLRNVKTSTPTGNGDLQNLSFIYDAVGNLIERHDDRSDHHEVMAYDGLNRLQWVDLTLPGTSVPMRTMQMSYDEGGRISAKEGVSYSYDSNGPYHAVKGKSDASYSYDGNGNQTLRSGGNESIRAMEYTAFDKPWRINLNGLVKESRYTYGANRNRLEREDRQSNSIVKRTWYLGNVEVVVDNPLAHPSQQSYHWRRQIGGVAQVEVSDSATNIHYYHRDHLQSLTAISSANASVFSTTWLSYDAFGRRRNESNWSQLLGLNPVANITDHGYGNHEMRDEFGFIHMGGRTHDPDTGQMMQADAIIQAPLNGQNLNRYSYVFNNPMSYSDPSGFMAAGNFFFGRVLFGSLTSPVDLGQDKGADNSQRMTVMMGNKNNSEPATANPGVSGNAFKQIPSSILQQQQSIETPEQSLASQAASVAQDLGQSIDDLAFEGGFLTFLLGRVAQDFLLSPVIESAQSIDNGDILGVGIAVAGALIKPVRAIDKASDAARAVSRVADDKLSGVTKGGDDFVDLTTPARRRHILDGDATGGGHRPGTGKPGKSEFPAGRSDDSIIHDISDIATDPTLRSRPGRGGRTITDGTRNGVDIRVIQERNGDIVTGFPTNTPRNPR